MHADPIARHLRFADASIVLSAEGELLETGPVTHTESSQEDQEEYSVLVGVDGEKGDVASEVSDFTDETDDDDQRAGKLQHLGDSTTWLFLLNNTGKVLTVGFLALTLVGVVLSRIQREQNSVTVRIVTSPGLIRIQRYGFSIGSTVQDNRKRCISPYCGFSPWVHNLDPL